MKMQYSKRNNRLSPRAWLAVGVVIVLILIACGVRFFFPGVFFGLITPLASFGNAQSEASSDKALFEASLRELQNENEALKARLRDVGAANDIPSEAGILAGVVLRPPVSPYDTLLLGSGSEVGIREGAIVFGEGIPIGTIVEAGEGYARASLYSSPGRETTGWLGEERIGVSFTGEGAGAFSASVPREAIVSEGDTVYFAGPGAYPAGIVRRIERHASSPEAKLFIEPFVNPFSLTFVRVVP